MKNSRRRKIANYSTNVILFYNWAYNSRDLCIFDDRLI